MSLHEELHRIADRAPVAEVPHDTYARGRRARRRERVGAAAGLAVLVALGAGLVSALPHRDGPQPAGSTGPGVPTAIRTAPAGALAPTRDLAVGRAAVAELTDDDDPVVIDAADGSYHALDLPGFGDLQRSQGVLSLSPDGRQLAWGWSRGPGTAGGSGVRIVDLETGRLRTVAVDEPLGILVYQLTWSPDSRWLLWDGVATRRADPRGWAAGPPRTGRIAPGSTTSQAVPRTDDDSTRFAIGDDGTVLVATTGSETWWDGRVVRQAPRPTPRWYPVVLTVQDGVVLDSVEHDPAAGDYRVDYRRVAGRTTTPEPGLAQVHLVPVGLLGDGTPVALSQHVGDNDVHLSLVDLAGGGGVREVATVDGAGQVTVATDLMTAQRPTVERPVPAWAAPGDGGRPWWLVLPVGLAAAAYPLQRRLRYRSRR